MISILLVLFNLYSYPTEKDHALYLSILEIDEQEMKVKVFSDDLKDALRNDESSIEAYFQKKIKLQVNGSPVGFELKEASEEGDSNWITFRLNEHEKWKSFSLDASYFMELYPDQINVVKVLGEKPQFFRLSIVKTSCKFDL